MTYRQWAGGVIAVAMLLLGSAMVYAQDGTQELTTAAQSDADVKALQSDADVMVLKSDADTFAKAKACQRLARIGGPEAVPALAPLLADEKLSAYARSALEAIGGPRVGTVLLDATQELEGELLIGVVNSLGVFWQGIAVDRLGDMARGNDADVACAALAALGRIATPDATEILLWALVKGPAEGRPAAAEACLVCAERLLGQERPREAVKVLYRVRNAEVPEHLRLAAACRTMVVRQSAGVPMLREHLRSSERETWAVTLRATREMPGDAVTRALIDELPQAPPGARAMIIQALPERSEGTEWAPIVQPYLDDKDESVGDAAATALAIAAQRLADAGDAESGARLFALTAPHSVDRATLSTAAAALRERGVTVDLAAREGFITRWRLLGPVGTHDGLLEADVVATDGPIDTTQAVSHGGQTLGWTRWAPDGSTGSIDLLKAVGERTDTGAYAYAEVVAPEARDILLKIGSDDDVYVWLNGALVHRSNEPRGCVPDQDVVEAALIAGTNTILAKVLNGTSDWGLAVRLTDLAGRPIGVEQVDLPGGSADAPSEPADVSALEFAPLFDGTTFDGWEGDTEKSFRIEEGAIVGGSLEAPIPRNEFLCTVRPYANFILRLECKIIEANGGIQFRSERVSDSAEMSGYQADMSSDGVYWGCLYDEARRGMLVQVEPAEIERIVKKDDWNSYEIRCEGPRIRLILNGETTVDYVETDGNIPLSGVIGLQIHSGGPSETWYRDVVIAELP